MSGIDLAGPGLLAVVMVVGLVLFAPRLMILLAWPVLFCYPHKLLYGILPLNAGLDDLLILAIALRMLVIRQAHATNQWAKAAVWMAAGMVFMEAAADFTGTLRYPVLRELAAKHALKGIILVLFTMALAIDIRSVRDVHRHVVAYAIAVVLAYVLVIVCFLRPSVSTYWEVYEKGAEGMYRVGTVEKRAFGPLLTPDNVGILACVTLPLALGLLFQESRRRLIAAMAIIMLVATLAALLVAKSRSAILGLGAMLALMTIFSKHRRFVIGFELIGILIGAVAFAGWNVFGAVEERFESYSLTRSLAERSRLWITTISNPSPWIVFFAEGVEAFRQQFRISPHNGYLDVLFMWGFGGLVAFTLLVRNAVVWARRTAQSSADGCVRGVAWAVRWSLLAIGVLALASDPWYSNVYRLSVFFFLVVINCYKWGADEELLSPEYDGDAYDVTAAEALPRTY